ncbi:Xpo1-domain-containing protein [Artomyces pyxidatus]|uniref:Xpo1-domain-containing protein n=1 Tax=Artomyces pyxidatus TaxID=48021 RepID=A0ACB8T6T8_9AGAM|nr:Xpo1-domain-containing protein [Artomyces pyxidatus]
MSLKIRLLNSGLSTGEQKNSDVGMINKPHVTVTGRKGLGDSETGVARMIAPVAATAHCVVEYTTPVLLIMEALLDFSREFDITLMDNVVMALYSGSGGKEQQLAQQVLFQFQDSPDAWTRVPDIMERFSYPQTKVRVPPRVFRVDIAVIELSVFQFIGLQILEKLINTRWKTLPEAQRQGVLNFVVRITVKVASDEATMHKEKTYINKLNLALVQILKQEWPHNWPTFIPELVESCKTNLSLCENNMVILRLPSEEVFDFSAEQMTQTKIKNLKNQMCGEFSEIFKLCTEILEEATKASLIKASLPTLLRFLNRIPLGYIFETTVVDVLLTRVDEREIFKICLEYWLKLAADLYDEIYGLLMSLSLGGTSGAQSTLNGVSLRENIYSDVLSNLRLVAAKIVKHEERVMREFMKESDTIVLYRSMRELLVYLTHLDVSDSETIVTEKHAKQVDGTEWSWQNLNALCGQPVPSLESREKTEKRFLATVTKDLLGLCEIKRGEYNKAVVVSDIMYTVGQYPRSLKAHWKFLKTVVNKLSKFMHETHEGVSCDDRVRITRWAIVLGGRGMQSEMI